MLFIGPLIDLSIKLFELLLHCAIDSKMIHVINDVHAQNLAWQLLPHLILLLHFIVLARQRKRRQTTYARRHKIRKDSQSLIPMDVRAVFAVERVAAFALYGEAGQGVADLAFQRFVEHPHKRVLRLRGILKDGHAVPAKPVLAPVELDVLMLLAVNYLRLQAHLLELHFLASVRPQFQIAAVLAVLEVRVVALLD